MTVLDLNNLTLDQNILLNQISDEIKDEFHRILWSLLEKTNKKVSWLVSSTFSRNNNQSYLFRDICYILLAIKLVEKDSNITEIIVPSLSMETDLKRYLDEHGISVSVISSRRLLMKAKGLLRPYWKLFRTATIFLRLWTLRIDSRKRKVDLNNEVTLITTFIFETSFDESGNFVDRNYPGLIDLYPPENMSQIYFVPHFYRGTLKKKFMRLATQVNDVKFLIKNDYLRFRDYLNVLLSAARLDAGILKQTVLHGVRIDGVLTYDFRRNRFEITNLYGTLNYYFVKRLKENGVKIENVVDWYENQSFNKGFIKGIRDFYPEVEVKGYSGFIVAFDHDFHHQPTDYEVASGIVPDEICTIGAGLVNAFKKFSKNVRVVTAPAYRFKHVLDHESPFATGCRNILVALPISHSQSLHILNLICDVCRGNSLREQIFVVKPHPALDFQRVLKNLSEPLPENSKVVYGKFIDQVAKASLMIGHNSSTCVEAIALGVPVIVVDDGQGFDKNPVPKSISNDVWRLCHTAKELAQAIEIFLHLLPSSSDRIMQISREVKREFFEPITRDGTCRLLSRRNDVN